jgi:hypothetical protein
VKRVLQTGFPTKTVLANFLGPVADLPDISNGHSFDVAVSNRKPPVGGITKAGPLVGWTQWGFTFQHITPFD